jgi:hypothetical protein
MNNPGQALLQVASEQGFLSAEENIRKGKLSEPFWRMRLKSSAQRNSQK